MIRRFSAALRSNGPAFEDAAPLRILAVSDEVERAFDFAKNRVDLGRHLLAASRSAYGYDEHTSLEKLSDTIGRYLMSAQETIDAHRREEPATVATYRSTFQIL